MVISEVVFDQNTEESLWTSERVSKREMGASKFILFTKYY
jgi:hypothetical protein